MKFEKADQARRIADARSLNPLAFDRLIDGAEVRTAAECWPWRGCTTKDGYGQIRIAGPKQRAHRVMFSLFNPGVRAPLVRHNCHNPRCINPAHLRAGTALDNAHDRMHANRGGDLRGTANGRSKLTDDDVRAIRASRLTGSTLAEQYGISKAMACRIKRGAAWSHIVEE